MGIRNRSLNMRRSGIPSIDSHIASIRFLEPIRTPTAKDILNDIGLVPTKFPKKQIKSDIDILAVDCYNLITEKYSN